MPAQISSGKGEPSVPEEEKGLRRFAMSGSNKRLNQITNGMHLYPFFKVSCNSHHPPWFTFRRHKQPTFHVFPLHPACILVECIHLTFCWIGRCILALSRGVCREGRIREADSEDRREPAQEPQRNFPLSLSDSLSIHPSIHLPIYLSTYLK
jgi:hypothetical protein